MQEKVIKLKKCHPLFYYLYQIGYYHYYMGPLLYYYYFESLIFYDCIIKSPSWKKSTICLDEPKNILNGAAEPFGTSFGEKFRL